MKLLVLLFTHTSLNELITQGIFNEGEKHNRAFPFSRPLSTTSKYFYFYSYQYFDEKQISKYLVNVLETSFSFTDNIDQKRC